jgi:malonyl-CoA O-methyltransferase
MTLLLPTRDGYDRWAELYDSDGNPLIELEEPHVQRLLGDIRGLAAIDVGCGTGRHALRMAEGGARVTAVDFSGGMLAQARKKPGAADVTWLEHDLTKPLPFTDASFDRVACCLVIDHIRDLRALFAELGRLVRPAGWIVATVMHPALMLKGVQARFHDPTTGQEVRPESVPNQISDYVMGALGAGLTIAHMSEHAVTEAHGAQNPRAARYVGWPMLLAFTLLPPKAAPRA